jgi:hypothetical protein
MPFATPDSVIRAGFLLLVLLPLSSCEHGPDYYSVPAQRTSSDDPNHWERIVRMTDADAPEHFLGDILEPLSGTWRWTGKRPSIRLRAPAHAQRAYFIDFAIPENTLKSTGPVTLTYLVNGRVLEQRQYSTPGEYTFEKDVPPEWIATTVTTLGAEINKTYSEPGTGKAYGFLLVSLGLKRN